MKLSFFSTFTLTVLGLSCSSWDLPCSMLFSGGMHVGYLVSQLGTKPGSLHWKLRVLHTGPPGVSPNNTFQNPFFLHLIISVVNTSKRNSPKIHKSKIIQGTKVSQPSEGKWTAVQSTLGWGERGGPELWACPHTNHTQLSHTPCSAACWGCPHPHGSRHPERQKRCVRQSGVFPSSRMWTSLPQAELLIGNLKDVYLLCILHRKWPTGHAQREGQIHLEYK